MIIERDVPVPVDDGNILRADVFRPADGKPAPVIMTLGPYGKGVRYKDGFAPQVCTFCVFRIFRGFFGCSNPRLSMVRSDSCTDTLVSGNG